MNPVMYILLVKVPFFIHEVFFFFFLTTLGSSVKYEGSDEER